MITAFPIPARMEQHVSMARSPSSVSAREITMGEPAPRGERLRSFTRKELVSSKIYKLSHMYWAIDFREV